MSAKKIYGLVGASLGHSFSQKYFRKKFDNQSINADYLNFEFEVISEIKDLLKQPDIAGLNVTIPFKETVMHYIDQIDPVAAQIGAVNTIQFKNGQTIGYNTDVYGFSQMIKPFFESHHEQAMILGTGGASKAVAYVLEQLGCNIIFISRTPQNPDQYAYSEVNDKMIAFNQLIINTTPVGTFPNNDDFLDLPYDHITPKHLVIDLIYNPPKSKFLTLAENKGATVLNGLTMLEQQAEKSWEIWNEYE